MGMVCIWSPIVFYFLIERNHQKTGCIRRRESFRWKVYEKLETLETGPTMVTRILAAVQKAHFFVEQLIVEKIGIPQAINSPKLC